LPGRWLRRRLPRDRFSLFAPSWAALALGLLLLVGSSWLAASPPAQAQSPAALASNPARPNVLMIVMDTVRPDHLSLYGYPLHTTPHLEQLARDSMVYTRAIAPSDMTLSTHASLFTGMYPSWHQAHCQPPEATYGHPLSPNTATLAEILAGHGYTTLGAAGNLYLRADFGLQRGFRVFRIPRPVPVLGSEGWYLLRRSMRRELSLVTDTAQFDRLFSRSEDVNKELFSLPELNRAPLFMFLNYMDAHFPYLPPAPFDRRFPGKMRRLTQTDLEADQQVVIHGRPMPAADHQHLLSQYDGGIAYIDAQVGEVVDWLKQRGAYDNTLIVVTTDHGEAFGEKNLVVHGNSAYQNLVRAALIVKYPKSSQTGVVDAPVSLTDVEPTILTALGYPTPKGVQGLNLLAPAATAPRQIYTESFPCPVLHPLSCPDGCLTRAAFSWPYKYIASSDGKRELYDLAKDPNETRNLLPGEPATKLQAELSSWIRTMPALKREELKLNPESLKRLKSLGYVQ
jgi:arylsulfatase A-like enzyme